MPKRKPEQRSVKPLRKGQWVKEFIYA